MIWRVRILTRMVPNVRPRVIRKIINAKLYDVPDRLGGQGHDAPEDGEPAGLDPHAIRDTHARSAASCQANNLNQLKESYRHTRPRSDKGGQTLRKDLSWAGGDIAEKFPYREQEAHELSRAGQIRQSARISTMNSSGKRAT